ncbi:hypothetical protein NDU88_007109 [Pleurodeles waltl]|uniref:Reverse transcriptase RNase H-like domain-containing protein n=1 Tax=Pleurodeles waltl TaxID=8319 RepID=A0AAV7NVU7_PLEWA|nr:hypothetical protein NDU88_007109 [Pleurodeles waltl]
MCQTQLSKKAFPPPSHGFYFTNWLGSSRHVAFTARSLLRALPASAACQLTATDGQGNIPPRCWVWVACQQISGRRGAGLSGSTPGLWEPAGPVTRTGNGRVNAERHFSSRSRREKEALAVHWAVKKLKNVLWVSKFEVRTDHKPLCEIYKRKGVDAISSRFTNWVVSLQDFDFEVKYIPGVQNRVADTFFKLVQSTEDNQLEEGSDEDLDGEVVCEIEGNGFDDSVVTEER